MRPSLSRLFGSIVGSAAAWGDGPWRAKTVGIAVLVTLLGVGWWLRDAAPAREPVAGAVAETRSVESAPAPGWDFSRPLPAYVPWSASYVGGFFLGWLFRRFLRLAVTMTALVILVLGVGKYLGWDSSATEEKFRSGAAWVEREADEARDYLTGLLPSAASAGVGGWLGFRRGRHRREPG